MFRWNEEKYTLNKTNGFINWLKKRENIIKINELKKKLIEW